MRKWILTGFFLSTAVLLFQCAAKKANTTQSNAAPAPAVQIQDPQLISVENQEKKLLSAAENMEQGATKEWLIQGKEILNNQCAVCHKAKDPMKYDEANWVRHMSRMVPKAKLTEEQFKYLRVYTLVQFRIAK